MNTPRDCENTFKPQLIEKNQTRLTQIDSQIFIAICQRHDHARNRRHL
ncbi:hypothetical protein ACN65P_001668 [Salmonella enterica subsp. enterica serovar Braenderup]